MRGLRQPQKDTLSYADILLHSLRSETPIVVASAAPISIKPTAAQRMIIEARFHNKVAVDHTTGCINWIGAVAGGGYGQFGLDTKVHRAHRVAYWLARGSIPPGQIIRHQCNNRRCVNPAHLVTGTHQDNMNDMTDNRHGRAKLTNKDVVAIWGLAILGWTPEAIAQEFNITVEYVRMILTDHRRATAIDYELDQEAARLPAVVR